MSRKKAFSDRDGGCKAPRLDCIRTGGRLEIFWIIKRWGHDEEKGRGRST